MEAFIFCYIFLMIALFRWLSSFSLLTSFSSRSWWVGAPWVWVLRDVLLVALAGGVSAISLGNKDLLVLLLGSSSMSTPVMLPAVVELTLVNV